MLRDASILLIRFLRARKCQRQRNKIRQRRKNKRTRSTHDEEKTQSSPCPLFLSPASPVHIILLQYKAYTLYTHHTPRHFVVWKEWHTRLSANLHCTVLCMFKIRLQVPILLDLLRSNYQINTERCRAHNLQHEQTRRPQHFSTRNVMCPCQIRFVVWGKLQNLRYSARSHICRN